MSKIEEFFKCSYSFYLTNIKKEKVDIVPRQLKEGVEKHKLFEEAVSQTKNKIQNNPENVIQVLEEELKSLQNYNEYENDCRNFLHFSESIFKQGGNPLPEFAEIKIFNEDLNIVGIIDRVDFVGEEILVLDYKTGNDNDISSYYFQLSVYVYLFENEYKKRVTNWGIFFSKSGNFVIERVNRKIIEESVEKIKMARQIITTAITNRDYSKNPTRLCKWCTWYNNFKCDGKNTSLGAFK